MKILIADDEKNIRDSLAAFLKLDGMESTLAENGLSALRLLSEERFDAAILDLRMPGKDGLELLAWIREQGLRIPVLMISAHGDIRDAVQAMKLGAADYLVKPFDPEELVLRLRNAVESEVLRNKVEIGRELDTRDAGIVGASRAMEDLRVLVAKVAPTPSSVLVTGESGTGKEVVARAIHALSKRGDSAFVPVNVAGIPDTLLESELFGYEKGAFTGAAQRKLGMFELSSGGTLFLDEIGDMPFPLQVKLLRVLQERRVSRLGGAQAIPVDTRIVAATNHDLEQLVKEGVFREDLYYRLNVVRIRLPSLRERPEDIAVLAGHFIERFSRRMGRKLEGLEPDALAALTAYAFPGNVRELENMIERAFIFAEGTHIARKDLSLESSTAAVQPRQALGSLDVQEQRLVQEALQRWDGNRTKAAAELGISRRTLLNKIKEYGIHDREG